MNEVVNMCKGSVLATAILGLLVGSPIQAAPLYGAVNDCVSVTKRPLSDFLAAQGTLNNPPQFFPPVKDYVGWADSVDPETQLPSAFALVDYAGLANAYIVAAGGKSLKTQVTGQVFECELAEGTAKITVKLVTANALGFAQSIADLIDFGFDFLHAPTIFGSKAQDVVDGKQPAKGTAFLRTTFTIEAPGAPLPDFLELVNGNDYAPASLSFSSKTIGRRPNGKRARLDVEQDATNPGDGWTYTVEKVQITDPRH